MKLIAEKLGKGDKADRLRFIRRDGSETSCAMPRQGTLPHDLVHYVVESALPLRHGFLSQVAAGAEAGFVMQVVHDPTSASVETEAIQTEALVEALQTQLWCGAFDNDAFLEATRLATAARGRAAFEFDHVEPKTLYEQAIALLHRWDHVPFHQRLELPLAITDR